MRYYYGAATTGTLLGGYTYLFDEVGNITKIWDAENSQQIAAYVYDDKNQLIQETIYHYSGSTLTSTDVFHYTYDGAGNLLTVTNAAGAVLETYTYGNNTWADLLTGYQGRSINYDGVGNPLNWYNGSTFSNLTWVNGRQLSSIYKSGAGTYSYTYDMAGYRSSKVVDGVTHYYHTLGGKLVRETYGTTVIDFIYHTDGSPLAMRYSTDGGTSYSTYYYVLNAQGDVVKLVHPYGDVVAEYEYDAWGRVLSATGSRADVNPLRYRGYYYDSESGFYYVSSRYYDPEIGRFLSPDSTDILTASPLVHTDKNLYAYCDNNPVVRADGSGEFWHIIVGAAVGAVISTGVTVITNLATGEKWSDGLFTAALSGAASGALSMTGVTFAGLVGGNAVISMATSTIEQVSENGGFENFDVRGVLIDGAIGAVSGGVGGKGVGHKSLMNMGFGTIRRTANVATHHGVSAGITEFGRAMSWYQRSTANFFRKNVKDKLFGNIVQEAVVQAVSRAVSWAVPLIF